MKLKDLLSITNARDIYVTTADHNTYFSMDNGQTFKASLFNDPDTDLTNSLYEMTVNYFTPDREDCIRVVVK